MRRHLVGEGKLDRGKRDLLTNLTNVSNPYGLPPADRMKWAEGLDVKTVKEQPEFDLLYWVGCSGSYDPRNQNVSQSSRKDTESSRNSFRSPWKRREVQLRSCPATGGGGEVSTSGYRARRPIQEIQRQNDSHPMPTLFQHIQERISAIRRRLAGHAPFTAHCSTHRSREVETQERVARGTLRFMTHATSEGTMASMIRREKS